MRLWLAALLVVPALPAFALDPRKGLSECSVEIWRSRDGIVGWVRAITQTPDGYLWVGTNAGVFRYGGGPVVAFEPGRERARANDVIGLGVAPDGTLWITPARGAPVCLPADAAAGARGDLQRLAAAFTDCAGPAPVQSLSPPAGPGPRVVDRDGNVWVGTRKGLLRTRPGLDTTPVTFTHDDGLPEDDVTALFEDREGSLWVGTRGGGLAQFSDRTLDARVGPPSLRDRWINTLAEDRTGALWVGTRSGLSRWSEATGERTFTRADGLPSDEVMAILPRGEDLWVGTSAGVARLSLSAATTPTARFETPVPASTPASALYAEGDTLWIGGRDDVSRFRLPAGPLAILPADPGVEMGEVRAFARDDQGTVWVSARGKPVRVVDSRLRLPEPADAALGLGKIRGIHRAADGTLWFATGDGLYRRRGGTFVAFTRNEGLPSEDLYQVLSDDRGFLWAGSNQGVARVSLAALDDVAAGRRARLDAVSFHTSDQRRNVEVVRAHPGAWKGQGGRLWFATSRGVVGVDLQRLRVNTLPPVVRIEQGLVDGRPVPRTAPGGAPLRFPPGSGALEFHFAAITLLEPRKATYRYRLEGFDPDWIEAGTRREAYYTNISPGHYRFVVQGSNADGVWNRAGDSVAFSLAPHFYESAWFYATACLCALGLALFIHRLRLAHVTGRYVATLAERTRVARELHDSLLQGMAAVLLHIQSMRKRAGRGTYAQTDALTGELGRLEDLLGANLEETRRFVRELREQPGTPDAPEPFGAALAQLVSRLGEGAAVVPRLSSSGTPFPLPRHTQREVLRIVHEAVTNAVKHAQACHIEVRVCYEGEILKVSINDDGRGFHAATAPGAASGHFGLLGMRERAASIGDLRIDSGPAGTHVELVTTPAPRESAHVPVND